VVGHSIFSRFLRLKRSNREQLCECLLDARDVLDFEDRLPRRLVFFYVVYL
jgi:hypothetical protein